jgi:AcrR family transcriptional regulator
MSRRERLRELTTDEIKRVARQQMRATGAASLSLNAIAREMGMVVSGLYRYFDNRDALITALIIDAYTEQAQAMHDAQVDLPRADYTGRLIATLRMYRRWALDNPEMFALIYGTPIPQYSAPDEQTVPAAAQVMREVMLILGDAYQAGALQPSANFDGSIDVQRVDAPPVLAHWGVVGWTRLHGMVILEAFNHLAPLIPDLDAYYDAEIQALLREGGLPAP